MRWPRHQPCGTSARSGGLATRCLANNNSIASARHVRRSLDVCGCGRTEAAATRQEGRKNTIEFEKRVARIKYVALDIDKDMDKNIRWM